MSSNNIVPSSGTSSSSSASGGGLTLAQANALFVSRGALSSLFSNYTGNVFVNGTLGSSGALSTSSTLSVTGTSTFTGNATFQGNVNLTASKSIVSSSANGLSVLGSTGGLQFNSGATLLSPFTIQSSTGVTLFSLLNGYVGPTPLLQINDGNNQSVLFLRSSTTQTVMFLGTAGSASIIISKPDNTATLNTNLIVCGGYTDSSSNPQPGMLTLNSVNNSGWTSLISKGGGSTFALPSVDAAFPGMSMISDAAGNLSLNYPGQLLTGTLSSSDITHLYTIPKLLINAPGSGKAIIIDTFFIHFIYPTTSGVPYTNGSDLYLNYSNSSVNNLASSTTINPQNLKNSFDTYAGTLGSFGSGFNSNNGMNPVNSAVYIRTNSPNFTTTADGTTTFSGTINYQIRYHIENLSTL